MLNPNHYNVFREVLENVITIEIEFSGDDVIKIKFGNLKDLSRYSERTMSKTPTCQKLAFRGKLSQIANPSKYGLGLNV